MYIAILGGKTLIDVVFLNQLAELYPDINLCCYGDSGKISFGKRTLNIEDIKKFVPNNFDIIINFSNDFLDLLNTIKLSESIYINLSEGEILLNGVLPKSKLIKIPCYSLNPLMHFLNIIKNDLVKLNIVSNHSIAEFGKDVMKKFHRDIQDSAYNVIYEENKEVLSYNVLFNMLDDDINEFGQSKSEQILISELSRIINLENIDFSLTSLLLPVNKASSIIINFELNNEISLEMLKKMIQKVGLTYSYTPISSILTENDDQIYAIRLRKNKNSYSVILVYDSLFRRVADVMEFLETFLVVKN